MPPSFLASINCFDQLLPNDGEQRSTGGDTLIYRLAKVATGLDCSDVHDDRLFAELFDEIIEKPPCFAFGVIPTVTDENCAHSFNLWLSAFATTCERYDVILISSVGSRKF